MIHPFFTPRHALRSDIEGLLSSFFEPVRTAYSKPLMQSKSVFPAINVSESSDAYHLEAEIPGVNPDALDLSVVGKELKISGERVAPNSESYRVHRQEIQAGEFSRSLKFATELNADGVEASFKNGVLSLHLPKAVSAKPKKIHINVQ